MPSTRVRDGRWQCPLRSLVGKELKKKKKRKIHPFVAAIALDEIIRGPAKRVVRVKLSGETKIDRWGGGCCKAANWRRSDNRPPGQAGPSPGHEQADGTAACAS